MFPYLCVSLIIAVLGVVSNIRNQKITLTAAFLVLAVFAGFRGDFTSDYNNYCEMFYSANSYSSLWSLLEANPNYFAVESGFLAAMYLFGRIIPSGELFLCLISVLTVYLFLKEIVKQSTMPWLSILLFVGIDMYYDSFNVTRQVLAAALVFCCTRFLKERSFWKYCLAMVAISTIHRTALLMIPMYFLLNVKPTKRNVITMTAVGAGFVVLLPVALQVVKMIFPMYSNYSWGMDGGSWKNLIYPVAIAAFSIIYLPRCYNSEKFGIDTAERGIQINALIYIIILTLCSTQVYMIMRISYFFSPYTWILVPNIISQIKNNWDRRLLIIAVAFFCILYPLVVYSNSGYDPYYFIGFDRMFG